MKRYGRRAPNTARIVLRDAQGSRIRVSDQRIIEVEFKDTQGNIVKVEEVFLISPFVGRRKVVEERLGVQRRLSHRDFSH